MEWWYVGDLSFMKYKFSFMIIVDWSLIYNTYKEFPLSPRMIYVGYWPV